MRWLLKAAFIIYLMLISLIAQASDIASCNGTVLQRRLALVQFGRMADAYIVTEGALPDICSAPVAGISDAIPDLLQGASVCGSSREGAVYYSCQISKGQSKAPAGSPTENPAAPIIETCRYSLVDQSVSCENRSVVTTFGEAG